MTTVRVRALSANAESRTESYVLKNRWWNGVTKGFLISTQMALVPMAWMGYWGIPLCHVSSYSLWIPTYMVESHFDMGLHHLSWAVSSSTLMVRQLVNRNRPLKMNVLTWSPSPSWQSKLQLFTLLLFSCRLRDSIPRPGQRWKPRSTWRLPLSSWGWQSPGRASGKPHWPSLLHAELLLHLLTLINSHPFPSCSTFHLRDAANGVCPSTRQWDRSQWQCLHPKCTSELISQVKIITSQA